MRQYKRINISEAKDLLLNDKTYFLDIRDLESYNQSSDKRAIHLTPENLSFFASATPKESPVIVMCYHGNNSQNVAQYLIVHGFEEVYSLDGGYEEWRSAM